MSSKKGPSGPLATMIVTATRQRDTVTHWVCDRVGTTGVYSVIGQTTWNAGNRADTYRSGIINASDPGHLVDEIRKEFEKQGFPVHVNGGEPLVEGATCYGIGVFAAPEA